MKELERVLFNNQSHVIIAGRTGSGKSHTIAKLIEFLMRNGKVFILMDYAGEYRIPGVSQRQPFFSYPLLRDSLPEVISEIIRLQSSTAGTWTYDAVAKLVATASSFEELLQKLEENADFPVRDAGARAAYSRLNMLKRFFSDENPELIQHYSLGNLQITERKMAITLLLTQIYNMILTGKLQNQYGLYIIVEEAINIPENLLIQLLTQLRGYGVKVILTTQEFRDWFQHYNLIIHDLGNINPYRYGLPRNNLKIGEVLIYNVERHKWKKVKIKPPKIVKVLPKSQNNGNTHEQEEDETQSTNTENRTQSKEEVGSETQVYSEEESTNNDNTKEEHSDNTEEIGETKETDKATTEEEDANTNNARQKAETKVLAEEIKSIHYTLSELEGAITELKNIRNEELNEVKKEMEWLKNSVRKLEERVDGLENLVKNSIYSIREELKDALQKFREQLTSEIIQKNDEEKLQEEPSQDIIETIIEEVAGALGVHHDVVVDLFKVEIELDDAILRPRRYFGEAFRTVNGKLRKIGFRIDRDKKGLHWRRSIYNTKTNIEFKRASEIGDSNA